MKVGDLFERLKEFWNDFKRIKSGLFGVGLLIALVLVVILEPFLLAYPETNGRWDDITYWQDLPRSAPPAWAAPGASKTEELRSAEFLSENDGLYFDTLRFIYNFRYEQPPEDMVLCLDYPVPPETFLSLTIKTPSGDELFLLSRKVQSGVALRVPLARDDDVRSTARFINPTADTMSALFSAQGNYTLEVLFMHQSDEFHEALDETRVTVLGKSHGLLGTDNSRRDLWSGLVAGMKWALIIGLLTALVSVLVGVLFGITSAYFGGMVDGILQRIYEICASIPLLPLLIVIGAIFKPNIWAMMLLMCAFFWTGSQKTVRAIALQIKEETFIEASEGFGASSWWVIFRHMFPLLLPYSLAQMALMVPSAIVYEATVSFLGLGDPTIVSWGQMLHDASTGFAVVSGMWWWVVPPGISIAIVGSTFAFLGFALDAIVAPRLRTL